MTSVTRSLARSVAIGSPLRRRMRRFTATPGVTLLAVAIVSAFLLPLVFMASTAFKEKSQLTALGAPLVPGPARDVRPGGHRVPGLRRAACRTARPAVLALVEPGREDERVRRPGRAGRRSRSTGWAAGGRSSSTGSSRCTPRTSPRPGTRSSSRGCCSTPSSSPAVGTIGAVRLVGLRGLRLQPLPLPRPQRPVPGPAGDDHPAPPGDPHPDLRGVRLRWAGSGPGCRSSSRTSSPTPTTCSCSGSTS